MMHESNSLPALDYRTRELLAREMDAAKRQYKGGIQIVVCVDQHGNCSHIKIVPAMH